MAERLAPSHTVVATPGTEAREKQSDRRHTPAELWGTRSERLTQVPAKRNLQVCLCRLRVEVEARGVLIVRLSCGRGS